MGDSVQRQIRAMRSVTGLTYRECYSHLATLRDIQFELWRQAEERRKAESHARWGPVDADKKVPPRR